MDQSNNLSDNSLSFINNTFDQTYNCPHTPSLASVSVDLSKSRASLGKRSLFSFKNEDGFIVPEPVASKQSLQTPCKEIKPFEALITAERLKRQLTNNNGFSSLTNEEEDEEEENIFKCLTEAKPHKKYPDFEKITIDDIGPIYEIIIDSNDKKSYEGLSSIKNLPSFDELLRYVQNKPLTQNDFNIYNIISYLLLIDRDANGISQEQRIALIDKIPYEHVNIRDTCLLESDIINFVFNTIILSINSAETASRLLANQKANKLIGELLSYFLCTKNYGHKRKIALIMTQIFAFREEAIVANFHSFINLVDRSDFNSVIITKLFQLMRQKQHDIILYLTSLSDMQSRINENDESLLYTFNILRTLLYAPHSQQMFVDSDYAAFIQHIRKFSFRPYKELNSVVLQLCRKIRNLS